MPDTLSYNRPLDNVAPGATVTLASPDSTYGVTYATDFSDVNLGRPSKSTITQDDWVFDFGSATRQDIVVVWGNFDAGLSLFWQNNATNVWTSPTVSEALTVPTKRLNGYSYKFFKILTGAAGYSAGGFRYGRLHMAAANSVAPGIKVWIGSSVRTLDRNISWGVKPQELFSNVILRTDGKAKWVYDLQTGGRLLQVQMDYASDADRVAIGNLIQAAGGGTKPILVLPDPTVNDAWLCRYVGPSIGQPADVADIPFDPSLQFINLNTMQLAFEEVTGGAAEWI